jgi:endonuclease YncB( thermonuclease family)
VERRFRLALRLVIVMSTVFRMTLSVRRRLVPLGLLLLMISAVSCVAPGAGQPALPQDGPAPPPFEDVTPEPTQPEPAPVAPSEEVFDALDTEALLDIGYSEPDRVIVVEGVVVRTFYAETSSGSPTFLDFHDSYQDWFTCVIWGEDREDFLQAFPPSPEDYFLEKRVRVSGTINIYQGAPEIILSEPSQIWVVSEVSRSQALVVRVIDGDTVEIEGGERVRYLGIDTPETWPPSEAEYYGEEATEKNWELVEGEVVGLEGDVKPVDEYGRWLYYVWLDDVMVNAELVRLGYAYTYIIPPNTRYRELFLRLEREAREQKLGLWAE